MDIRKKAHYIFVGSLILVLAILSVVPTIIFFDNYAKLDANHVDGLLTQTYDRIQSENTNLEIIVAQWTLSDSLSSLLETGNPTFIENYVRPEGFQKLSIDFVIITTAQGNIIFGQEYDSKSNLVGPLSRDLVEVITDNESQFRSTGWNSRVSGVLNLPEGPLVLTAEPVFSLTAPEQRVGTVIVGRFLDEAWINRFSLPEKSILIIEPIPASESPNDLLFTDSSRPDALKILINPADTSMIVGHRIIKDIDGDDALLLTMKTPTEVIRQGEETILFFIVFLLIFGLAFGLFMIFFWDRMILSRTVSLSEEIDEITRGENLGNRVTRTGNDEISRLADSMNRMLGKIEKTQNALKDRERQYRELAEQFPEIMLEINEKGIVTFVNLAAYDILGYTDEDLINNLHIPNLLAPEDVERARQMVKRILTGESSRGDVFTLIRKDGGRIPVISYVSPIIRDDKIRGLRLFAGDISERKRMEDALRVMNNKLNLMNNITRHDIFNQLTILFSYLDIIKDQTQDPLIHQYLEKQHKAAETIREQIAFTENYQEIGVTAPHWQNVRSILMNAVSPLDLREITLSVDIPDIDVFADDLLGKVFYNLVENGVKYGGKISRIRFFWLEAADGLVLIYEDDGIGIPSDAKEKIFNRQFFSHTGLGMFLSREILSITGIALTETGIYGAGARFEIHIPHDKYRPAEKL
jgi:PAS domain S-box-containing protein